jgi:CubicO group peptidase (beta-lactamase class C family)
MASMSPLLVALLFARPAAAAPALDQLRILAGPRSPSAVPTLPPLDDGIDDAALKQLLAKAAEEHSDAVVILKDGKLVVETGEKLGEKMYAMSATKSIASLAMGALLDEGKLKSLDQKASDFIPSWRGTGKEAITIRMLLNHTSGISTQGRGANYALAAPLVFTPGTAFTYNNPAVDLLALIIKEASGMAADGYIARKILEPLGITDWEWAYMDDLPLTAGELKIRPVDLAKIGQMVLDGGVWKGERIIAKEWLLLSAKASQDFDPTCGLLWWRDAEVRGVALTPRLLETWKKAGLRTELVEKLRPLVGRTFKDVFAHYRELQKTLGADFKELNETLAPGRWQGYEIVELGPVQGFSAQGFLGQYLVIDPARGLVGVRMRKSRPSDYPTEENPNPDYVDVFDGFPDYVHALAKP